MTGFLRFKRKEEIAVASEIKRRFTDTEMQIVRETDLLELLTHLGYQVKRIGRYHTTAEMDSLRMEQEFEQYMKAVKLLEDSGIPQEVLKKEKAELYEQLSEVNRNIRAEREKLKLCREICRQTPVMEQDIQKTEEHQKEVREHEHRRR